MKVKQLVKILRGYDQEMEVAFFAPSGDGDDGLHRTPMTSVGPVTKLNNDEDNFYVEKPELHIQLDPDEI